jgi:hypothetical protein
MVERCCSAMKPLARRHPEANSSSFPSVVVSEARRPSKRRQCPLVRTSFKSGHIALSLILPLRVNRVTLTARRSLPVFPDKRTLSVFLGTSQTCQISEVPDATLRRRQKQRNYSRVSFRTWDPMTRYRRVKFLNTSARRSNCFPFVRMASRSDVRERKPRSRL